MKIRHSVVSILLFVVACSDGDPPTVLLTLSTAYDAVAVGRVFPDSLSPNALQSFRLSLDDLQVSGGRVVGKVSRGTGSIPSEISGTFDPQTGELRIDPIDAALTSTVTERMIAFGGRADESMPEDGVANEITGFANTELGRRLIEGQFIAVARTDGLPPDPKEGLITAKVENLGTIKVSGEPGSMIPSIGIEAFRYTVSTSRSDFVVAQARDDGSFSFFMDGAESDIVLIRGRAAGRVGNAFSFRVGP